MSQLINIFKTIKNNSLINYLFKDYYQYKSFYKRKIIKSNDYFQYLKDIIYKKDLVEGLIADLNNKIDEFKKDYYFYIKECERQNLEINVYLKKDILLEIKKIEKNIKEIKYKLNLTIYQFNLNKFEKVFDEILEIYRYLINQIASLATRLDWQTIAYDSSVKPNFFLKQEVGYKGIIGYKRVHYPKLNELENWFLKEFIESPIKDNLCCFFTSSGMGAYTLIENFLTKDCLSLGDKILFANRSYFETRDQINKLKGFIIKPLLSIEAENIFQEIIYEKPKVVFLEPINNEEKIIVIDIHKIIKKLLNYNFENDFYIVVDTSMTSGGESVFLNFDNKKNKKVHLIAWESLLKYRQFGMDRFNAGLVIAEKIFQRKLFVQRERTGTILPDIQTMMFPKLGKKLYENRMKLIQRNASIFTSEISNFLTKNNLNNFLSINYPGYQKNKGYLIAKKYKYIGGVVTFEFKDEKKKNIQYFLTIINYIISQAKKHKIQINHGTSFGFYRTRITIAATGGGIYTNPFIRFSIGEESIKDLYLLIDLIKKCLKDLFLEN